MLSADSSRTLPAPAPALFSILPSNCHPFSSPRKRYGSQSYIFTLDSPCHSMTEVITGGTYMASGNNLILSIPDQTIEREKTGRDIQHSARRLFWGTWIHNGDTAIMPCKRKHVPTRREGNALDPSRRIVQKLATDGIKWKAFSPSTRLRSSINPLDETREYSRMRVRRSCSKENRVWMPGKSGDGTPNRLFEVFGDPPIVLLFKVAYCDHAGTRPDGKFLFRRRPAHKSCGPIDPK